MVCIVRFSKKMMTCIHEYATKYKTLYFLEALFPTTAIQNKLNYVTPSEFHEIHYRTYFRKQNIKENQLYHPVKEMHKHIEYREQIRAMTLKGMT